MRGNANIVALALLITIGVLAAGTYFLWIQSIAGQSTNVPSRDVEQVTAKPPEIASVLVAPNGTDYNIAVVLSAGQFPGNPTVTIRDGAGKVVATVTGTLICTEKVCKILTSTPLSKGVYSVEVVDKYGRSASYFPVMVR